MCPKKLLHTICPLSWTNIYHKITAKRYKLQPPILFLFLLPPVLPGHEELAGLWESLEQMITYN